MHRGGDRRVERTRSQLHEALASLIHEKSYDDIVVKEILARADVGRSTFYSHFRDKDDLLDSGIRDLLRGDDTGAARAVGSSSADRILGFAAVLFDHVERSRDGERAHDLPARMAVVHDRLEQELAAIVRRELERPAVRGGRGRRAVPDVPADLLARYVASTFVVVLDWWMGSDAPVAASEANGIFRGLVMPALEKAITNDLAKSHS